jgi:DNA polymerase-3 subunit gamma/tau
VVAALYRRYRPETFAELIGQSQVTDPLRTALRTDRVNHAYLFSGPRGCGKTTSARILARCLNCAEGPTDTPCGVCPSCVELSRDGSGSLDVVEIDAASHNGVDDARDLRERAVFAPARDRFKIFILDEAHMVTPQGFNALLKIVEEPPEHVKFIFATTEPEKVIGTIRSRTHHYPFRLVPPAQMLDYVQQLCTSEGVEVEPGVLPLVVRAGGGSVRDTLSLLDQLIAGSESTTIEYERAVALLGYTHGALLDEVVEALGARDAGAAFGSVDRVIQTGQDPRRFVEDLLERLRDLIIVAATSGNAASVLRGVPQDQLDRMAKQASTFGTAELSRSADVVNAALTEMTGATSPRLHLELMVARILVPASDDSERGALARVERLERRVGMESPAPAAARGSGVAPAAAAPAAPGSAAPAAASAPAQAAPAVSPAPVPAASGPAPSSPAPSSPAPSDSAPAPTASGPASPTSATAERLARAAAAPAPAAAPVSSPTASSSPAASASPVASSSADPAAESGSTAPTASSAPGAPAQPPVGPVTFQQVKDSWPEILEVVKNAKLNAWLVVYTAQPLELREGRTLVLSFPSQKDVEELKKPASPGQGVGDLLKKAFIEVLGLEPALIARVDASSAAPAPAASADEPPVDDVPPPDDFPPTDSQGWAVTAIPYTDTAADEAPDQTRTKPALNTPSPAAPSAPAPASAASSEAATSVTKTVAAPSTTAPLTAGPSTAGPSTTAPSAAPSTAAPDGGPSASSRATTAAATDSARYGESVVREILGASFIEEQPVTPRVVPRPEG